MKKLLLLLLTTTIYADDLDLGDDFSTGETVTAEKFNSKFNKLETVNRLVKDSDLIGTWNCRSVTYRENYPFTQFSGGFLWYLDGEITFSETDQNSSTLSPKNWSSGVEMIYDDNLSSGIYSLFANMLITTLVDNSGNNENSGEILEVDLMSENQIRLIRRKQGGGADIDMFVSLCNKST